jgi:argininosuccinate lyase
MTLWGGRFESAPSDAVFALSRSVTFDWRLAPYDLIASLAHLKALKEGGLIGSQEAEKIEGALKSLLSEVKSSLFMPNEFDEDVHSALERGLREKIGDLGGSLRAGRSRNDQVATDLRLYLLDHMLEISALLVALADAFIKKAEEHIDVIAPGFTHLQHAQPISFSQELAKHAWAIDRDLSRIRDWFARTNFSPLGAGALSGTSLPIDPAATAESLGFSGPIANSIDAVSDRDFVAEALFIIALIGVHLSRIGEEWTLWSSSEFGWANLDDAFATGSSIMPQKKNPDVAELARGKTGRFIGNATAILVTLKGLPFAYNRDLQEDKEPTFDSVENLQLILKPLIGMVASTTFNKEIMRASAPLGFSLATEIADYLVKKGTPFAIAHEIAGRCVKYCESNNLTLNDLTAEALLNISPQLEADLLPLLDVEEAVQARNSVNGVAPLQVREQLKKARANFSENTQWISRESARLSGIIAP